MWEHLSDRERHRRVALLEASVERGDLTASDSEFFGEKGILGLWAIQAGDSDRAFQLWTEEFGTEDQVDVLADPRTDASVLSEAADDRDNWPDLSINVATPPQTLARIWDEGGPSPELAEHPLLPMECLEDILDQDEDVILASARNSGLDEATWQLLMSREDPDPWAPWSELRVELHRNVALPEAVLRNAVPLDAQWLETYTQGLGDEVFREEDIAIAVALVKHPGLSAERLAAYAKDINPEVRRAVALNPRTPPEVASYLAGQY